MLNSHLSIPVNVHRLWLPVLGGCMLLGFAAGGSFAQTYSMYFEPCATGCTVDYEPFDWSAPADAVESGMLIGNINGKIRKAILEYDISDLVSGVVDSARLTGEIGPNNSYPAGDRRHRFHISAGNGVVDVSDSIPGYAAGIFVHPAGTRTAYDFDITQSFRIIALPNPAYLCQAVWPGGDEQGWDVVGSLSPSPKLELEVRYTTPSTEVYYQAPTASAAAHAQDGGGFTVDPSASAAEVMDWPYAPFERGRGLMEYDLSSIPAGANVLWAKLDVFLNGLQAGGGGTIGPDLELLGYAGDGTVTDDDLLGVCELIGTSGEMLSTGAACWDIDPSFVESLLHTGNHLGLIVQPGVNPQYMVSFYLDFSTLSIVPHLVIAYEFVPAQLMATEPPADGTLPKMQNNIIVCVFDAPITLPPSGDPLVTTELADPNNDVSSSFSYSVDPNDTGDPTGATLKATENGAVLPDQTWYHINSAPGWADVAPFDFDLCTLRGDANNTGRVTTSDYSMVKAHLGERDTDARYDLNGSSRVTVADYSVVKVTLGNRAPTKP